MHKYYTYVLIRQFYLLLQIIFKELNKLFNLGYISICLKNLINNTINIKKYHYLNIIKRNEREYNSLQNN